MKDSKNNHYIKVNAIITTFNFDILQCSSKEPVESLFSVGDNLVSRDVLVKECNYIANKQECSLICYCEKIECNRAGKPRTRKDGVKERANLRVGSLNTKSMEQVHKNVQREAIFPMAQFRSPISVKSTTIAIQVHKMKM